MRHTNKMKNGNRMATRSSNSRTIKGEQDYRFHTPRQAKRVALYSAQTPLIVKGNGNGTTTTSIPSQAGITNTFVTNINNGYNRFGCSFVNARWKVLSDKLMNLQTQGTNPNWQNRLNNKLNWLYNFGQKNGCWSANTGGGFSGVPNNNNGGTTSGSFACKKSGAYYGMKKVDGRVRGEIKRPLDNTTYKNPLNRY